ncbi:MAG: EAL domain-containing protein [Bdellovibrionales bacterium]
MTEGLKSYFQPIHPVHVNHEGASLCVETLARMVKDGKTFSPDQFLPNIEALDKMPELFRVMFKNACELVAHTSDKLPLSASVNLDAKTILTSDMGFYMSETTKIYGVNPGAIKLEIVEASYEQHLTPKEARLFYKNLAHMHLAGFPISMDDFGQDGSNAYRYLTLLRKGINVGTIKLDKTLMPSRNDCYSDVLTKQSQCGFSCALRYAKANGISLDFVLEGADRHDIDYYQQRIGPDHALYKQGYHWGMPQSAETFYSTHHLPSKSFNLK